MRRRLLARVVIHFGNAVNLRAIFLFLGIFSTQAFPNGQIPPLPCRRGKIIAAATAILHPTRYRNVSGGGEASLPWGGQSMQFGLLTRGLVAGTVFLRPRIRTIGIPILNANDTGIWSRHDHWSRHDRKRSGFKGIGKFASRPILNAM